MLRKALILNVPVLSSSVFEGLQSTGSYSFVQGAENYSATTQRHFISTKHNITIQYVAEGYLKLKQILYNWLLSCRHSRPSDASGRT